MMEILGLTVPIRFLANLMLSLAFFVGILLMVSRDAFVTLNKDLQREYGIKRRMAQKLEDVHIDVVDRTFLKYPVPAGLLIAIAAFILLLIRY